MSGSFPFVTDGFVTPRMGVGSRDKGFWFGSRLGVEVFELEFMVMPEDVERTIEPSSDRDLVPRWGQGGGRGQELDIASIEGNGPIVVDGAG